MEYTKGEWEITLQYPGVFGIWAKQEGIRLGIADVFHTTDNNGEANANLIAAAPAMYEALKDMNSLNFLDPNNPDRVWERGVPSERAIIRAFTALLKAEGK